MYNSRKGIKPIKAQKYYYFKYNTVKLVDKYKVSHNDIEPINRGAWRKYNPYNPYVPEQEEKKVEDVKIESLDDLFEETPEKPEEIKTNVQTASQKEQKQDDAIDIQKELEAKFDELFGAFDDEE